MILGINYLKKGGAVTIDFEKGRIWSKSICFKLIQDVTSVSGDRQKSSTVISYLNRGKVTEVILNNMDGVGKVLQPGINRIQMPQEAQISVNKKILGNNVFRHDVIFVPSNELLALLGSTEVGCTLFRAGEEKLVNPVIKSIYC